MVTHCQVFTIVSHYRESLTLAYQLKVSPESVLNMANLAQEAVLPRRNCSLIGGDCLLSMGGCGEKLLNLRM